MCRFFKLCSLISYLLSLLANTAIFIQGPIGLCLQFTNNARCNWRNFQFKYKSLNKEGFISHFALVLLINFLFFQNSFAQRSDSGDLIQINSSTLVGGEQPNFNLPDLGEPTNDGAKKISSTDRSNTIPSQNADANILSSGLGSGGNFNSSNGFFGYPTSPPFTGASKPNPTASNFAPAIALGSPSAGATVGANAANFHHQSEKFLANIGVNYVSPQSNFGYGIKASLATILGSSFGIGTNLTINQNNKEAVINGVWIPEDTQIKIKGSTAYMWGSQNFNFYTGNANANLRQISYYLSSQYLVPKKQSDILHSLGISAWGANATQINNPEPVYAVTQNATAWQIMMDPRKLAVGNLQGSSLDSQIGITKEIIAKASLGYESLKFPFSDGTKEINNQIYQDYVLQYQPIPGLAFQAEYKIGAALNNVVASVAYGPFQLGGFRNIGNNGISSSTGMMLTYTATLDPNIKARSPTILFRPELSRENALLLRDAATRPIQLPQNFLAKVDATAVKTIANINKNGLNGASVDALGDLIVLAGEGGGQITQITLNGAPYANTGLAQLAAPSGSKVVVHTKLLNAIATGSTYVIYVTDTANVQYTITIKTTS